MVLIVQLKEDTNQAMKSGEASKLEVLRGLLASLHNREIELRGKDGEPARNASPSEADGLSEEEILSVLSREAKSGTNKKFFEIMK